MSDPTIPVKYIGYYRHSFFEPSYLPFPGFGLKICCIEAYFGYSTVGYVEKETEIWSMLTHLMCEYFHFWSRHLKMTTIVFNL